MTNVKATLKKAWDNTILEIGTNLGAGQAGAGILVENIFKEFRAAHRAKKQLQSSGRVNEDTRKPPSGFGPK